MQFYELRVPASEINLPAAIEDVEAMEELLTSRAGRSVRILIPQRGDKRALVELATRNAELSTARDSTKRQRLTSMRSKRCAAG